MCGIVGYIGGQQAAPLLLEGLARLEHRGYDSAGLAVLGGSAGPTLKVAKKAGRVRDLADAMPEAVRRQGRHRPHALGHPRPGQRRQRPPARRRRRATSPSCTTASSTTPRRCGTGWPTSGVELVSETDTEVLAHLIGRSEADTLEGKVSEALAQVEGTYGIAVVHAGFPDRIVVARNGSPLIIGVGDKEMYVASDLGALVRYTTTVAHLDDGELATVTATGFTTYRQDLSTTARAATKLDLDPADYDAGEHDSFMHKEMLEQPAAAERVLRGRLDERFGTGHLGGLNMDARETRAIRRVKILGCGSAYYVGQMGAALLEELARIPADAEAASEFRYRNPIIEPDTLYVAVSQSGETVDTLLAVQEIRRKGGRVIGLVNVVGSAIAREVDGGIYLHAGPEVAVASTKALTTMFLGFSLLALQLGRVRDLSIADGKRLIAGLTSAARPDRVDPRAGGGARGGRGRAGRGGEPLLHRAACAASRSRGRARRSSRRSATATRRPTRPPSSSTVRWR